MTPLRVALLGLDAASASGLARELRRQPARRPVRVAVGPGAVVWTCAGWLAARLMRPERAAAPPAGRSPSP